MKEVVGDIWDFHKFGYTICITTNGTLNKAGHAVMGAGIAKQCKQRYPHVPALLGTRIKNGGNKIYHLGFNTGPGSIFSFPTKHNWYENSDLTLIIESAKDLQMLINSGWEKHPIILTRPGCGLGNLDWETQVKPAIKDLLSDDVWIITNE